jgi:hypothetical protein
MVVVRLVLEEFADRLAAPQLAGILEHELPKLKTAVFDHEFCSAVSLGVTSIMSSQIAFEGQHVAVSASDSDSR